MPRHSESRPLPFTPEAMFELVADVGRYQEFLPWVLATRIRSDSETEMVADMVAGFKSLRETFTSRVLKHRPDKIVVDYVEGPLKFLHNEWRFRPGERTGCIVDFSVEFEFRSRVFESLAGQVFDRALMKMTDAFESRAFALYGPAA
jgi:coenzyme Q-binding protein COQ10